MPRAILYGALLLATLDSTADDWPDWFRQKNAKRIRLEANAQMINDSLPNHAEDEIGPAIEGFAEVLADNLIDFVALQLEGVPPEREISSKEMGSEIEKLGAIRTVLDKWTEEKCPDTQANTPACRARTTLTKTNDRMKSLLVAAEETEKKQSDKEYVQFLGLLCDHIHFGPLHASILRACKKRLDLVKAGSNGITRLDDWWTRTPWGTEHQAAFWKLNQIVDGFAVFLHSDENYLIAVEARSLGNLHPGVSLRSSTKCLKFLGDDTSRNLRGFPVPVKKYRAVACK